MNEPRISPPVAQPADGATSLAARLPQGPETLAPRFAHAAADLLSAPVAMPLDGALAQLGLDRFMVATGIECSAPVIAGGVRQDQLRRTGHWDQVEGDVELVRGLGIPFLRYGIPFHVVARDPAALDWAWTDRAMAAIAESGVEPIADLLHFGLPDDLWGMADPALPDRYLAYVAAFLERYPSVRWFTPVNEPYITALMSARRGWWNEQRTDDDSFVAAMDQLLALNLQAMAMIRRAHPDARFLQSDGCEEFRPDGDDPASMREASLLDGVRFLAFDLTLGRRPDAQIAAWLAEHGVGEERLAWFAEHAVRDGIVVGLDYYSGNEHVVAADGTVSEEQAPRGFGAVARDYVARYGLPTMLAETNHDANGAVAWMNRTWADGAEMAAEGLPFVGYCWYSLTDQVDWDTCLREDNGRVNSFGLVDLNRQMRSAGERFRELAAAVARDPRPAAIGLA